NKTPYELVHDKKPDLTFFRVFGALCYPINDIGIFVGYAPSRKGYRIYNKRTRRLMETIHVTFDEMHQSMAPVRMSSGPAPFIMTPGQLKSGLAPTDKELEMLFQPMLDEHLEQSRGNELVPSATEITAHVVPPEEPTHEDTPINQDVLHPSHNLVIGDPGSAQSSSGNVHQIISEDGPKIILWITSLAIPLVLYLHNIVGNPSRPVSTRKQLASDALWCCFHTELSKVEPKNFKMAVIEDCLFQAMQMKFTEFSLVCKGISSEEGNDFEESLLASCTDKRPLEIFIAQCGTKNMIIYQINPKLLLSECYAELRIYAGVKIQEEGTSEVLHFFGDRLVRMSSKKQRSTEISTTEAEYIGHCQDVVLKSFDATSQLQRLQI
ncbi:putative ribonuclease H-like domain-containing protein, partial [Tanacetum coccineum]